MKRPLLFFIAGAVWRRRHAVVVAVGYAVAALGVVHGLGVFLVGLGIVSGGAFGFTFQYQECED